MFNVFQVTLTLLSKVLGHFVQTSIQAHMAKLSQQPESSKDGSQPPTRRKRPGHTFL